MPKQVDHEQRRREISRALWRIAAERGLEAVSMREVANAASMSIGLVQHYFATKDEMVMYATSRMRDQLGERIRQALEAVPEPVTQVAALRALLAALLPADAASRTETLVGIAVFFRALNDPPLADRYRLGRAQLTAAVAGLLRETSSPAEDVELAAETLLALVNGLASDLLVGHVTLERALRILDQQVTAATGSFEGGPVRVEGDPA